MPLLNWKTERKNPFQIFNCNLGTNFFRFYFLIPIIFFLTLIPSRLHFTSLFSIPSLLLFFLNYLYSSFYNPNIYSSSSYSFFLILISYILGNVFGGGHDGIRRLSFSFWFQMASVISIATLFFLHFRIANN